MSQPKIYGPSEIDPLSLPLTHKHQLIELFHGVERKPKDCLLGIEYEMFGQAKAIKKPLPYEGETSITTLFKRIAKDSEQNPDPFTPVMEDQNIVALLAERATIALEPGGQIEVALKPCNTLSEAVEIFHQVVKEIEKNASTLGIDLFALGIHPLAAREDMARVKKSRYEIMRQYMGSLSGLGLDMMTRSCAIQVNLDFTSEADMVEKTRLAAALVPFYSLLCSSVAFIDGKPSSYALERGNVWRKTDPARTGIPAVIFDRNFSYESWIEFALDVPMYFIRRGKTYHDVSGSSFRDFMSKGLLGFHATLRDFVDHLTAIFTEVRLKPILELRSPDSLPVPFVNAITALSWALFYDENARSKAKSIFSDLTHPELILLQNAVIDKGRAARFRDEKVFTVTERLLDIAQEALAKLSPTSKNPSLSLLLKPLSDLVEKDTTCAEWIKKQYVSINEQNFPKLLNDFSVFNNPIV